MVNRLKKNLILPASVVVVSGALSLACQPSSQPVSPISKVAETPESKPSRVGAVRVASVTFRELSRLDRTLRPFLSISRSGGADDPFQACRKAAGLRDGQGRVNWYCEVELLGTAKVAIRGVEDLEFDKDTNLLQSEGRFETQHLNDLDAEGKPYTLQTRRVVKVQFENGSTPSAFRARLRLKSDVMKKDIRRNDLGSNWSSNLSGHINNKGGNLTLEKGARIMFRGSLYGEYGERKTNWASGGFFLVADSDIALTGLSDGPCIKPDGRWRVEAKGDGQTLETSIASTQSGIIEAGGSQLEWSKFMCFEP